jgi:hypothetical protein
VKYIRIHAYNYTELEDESQKGEQETVTSKDTEIASVKLLRRLGEEIKLEETIKLLKGSLKKPEPRRQVGTSN